MQYTKHTSTHKSISAHFALPIRWDVRIASQYQEYQA